MGITRDAGSKVTGVTDGNGNVRHSTYDAAGNLTGYTNRSAPLAAGFSPSPSLAFSHPGDSNREVHPAFGVHDAR